MIKIFIIVLFLIGSFIVNVDSGAAKFKVTEVIPRIITPTSQQVTIRVESVDYLDLTVNGRIFDITGMEVALMEVEDPDSMGENGYAYLTWRPGSNMPSGVYIYQLEAKGYIYNGTIVVAR